MPIITVLISLHVNKIVYENVETFPVFNVFTVMPPAPPPLTGESVTGKHVRYAAENREAYPIGWSVF